MDTSVPGIACVLSIGVFFVLPMYVYILFTERKAKRERARAIEAGRHEPVTIQPYIDPSVCMGSGACVPACPEHVLSVIEGQAVAINMSACIGHGACVSACPVGAIELVFGSEKRGIDIPRVGPDFQTNVPGVYIAGELGGMGLIANAAEQGTRALGHAAEGLRTKPGLLDVAIVGAGPAGLAAAAAAKKRGLSYVLLEQDALGGAIRHYPRKKLVFTRPMEIEGYPKVNLRTLHKEALVDLFIDVVDSLGLEVSSQERVDKVMQRSGGGFKLTTTKRELDAQRVILSLGRRGTPRKLDARGEDTAKVAYSLLEPENYSYDHLLIVGGGDSAVEAAIQLSEQPGNKVTLSYRGDKINRPKEKNLERLKAAQKEGRVEVMLESAVVEIRKDRVVMEHRGEQLALANDYVFVMVGGVLPTKFLQDVGIQIEKHYGKRVEVADEPPEPSQSVPSPSPRPRAQALEPGRLATLPPQSLQGNDEQTLLGLKKHAEKVRQAMGEDDPTLLGLNKHAEKARRAMGNDDPTLSDLDKDLDDIQLTPANDEPTLELAAAPSAAEPLPDLDLQPGPQTGPARVSALPKEIVTLIQAAEASLAAGGYDAVLAIAERLTKRMDKLSAGLAPDVLSTARRWMLLLEGEARLGIGEANEATEAFGASIDAGPEDLGPAHLLQRARIGLARACFRIGAPLRASEPLMALLQKLPPDDARNGEVLRMSAESVLEAGDLELAEVRWGEAAEEARDRGSADERALAQRGIARCTAIRGQLRLALRQLSEGVATLAPDSEPEVVAALLSDAVQLECALGRYGSAVSHGKTLLEWTVDSPASHARALGLLASALCAVGSYAAALGHVVASVDLAVDLGSEAIDAKLRAARLLCDLGRNDAAKALLDTLTAPPPSAVHDYEGQQLALRARSTGRQDREIARSLATTALARSAAGHPLSAAALRLDAARALFDADSALAARTALKRALKVVPGADPKGARLELLILLHELGSDDANVAQALARTAARVMAELPKELAGPFRARAGIAPALASSGAVPPDPATRPLAVPPPQR